MAGEGWLSLLVLVFHLFPTTRGQYCVPLSCVNPTSSYAYQPADHTKDYLYIGGIFDVHQAGDSPYKCGNSRQSGIQNLEAFLWAVRTFKIRYPNSVLQTVQVGAFALDSCSTADRGVQQVLNMETCAVAYGTPPIEPSRVLGWVGTQSNKDTMQLASVIGGMKKTLVSSSATAPELSNRDSYPYFLRTVPAYTEQVYAMASVLKSEGWLYVQLIYTNDSYGLNGAQAFHTIADASGICISYQEAVPKDATTEQLSDILKTLVDNKETRAVVMFVEGDTARSVLEAANTADVRGVFTWYGTTSWGTHQEVIQGLDLISEGAVTISLDQETSGMSDFKQYWNTLTPDNTQNNPWFKEYWMDTFQCNLPNENKYHTACDVSSQSLKDIALDENVPYTIKAVDAIVNGLENARASECLGTNNLCTGFINNFGKWDIIHEKITRVNVDRVIEFDPNTGDTKLAQYNVQNFRTPHDNCATHCYTQVSCHHLYTCNCST